MRRAAFDGEDVAALVLEPVRAERHLLDGALRLLDPLDPPEVDLAFVGVHRRHVLGVRLLQVELAEALAFDALGIDWITRSVWMQSPYIASSCPLCRMSPSSPRFVVVMAGSVPST